MDPQAMLSQEMPHMVPSDAPQVPPLDGKFPLPAIDSTTQSAPSPDVQLLPQQWQSSYTVVHGQVMTEEQLETLRRQISVYATICKQLVEMHKAVVAQQNTLPGLRLGQSVPFDPANHSAKQFGSRQRWTPSQTQLQVLEKIFEQGSGTINKQRIKEITMELTQYGPISETNVYNWFQNRRARTKRKQQVGGPNNGESEFDTDNDSPEEKRVKTERDLSNESYGVGQVDTNFQSIDSAEHQLFDQQKRVQPSLMQEQVDHFAVTPNRTLLDSHAFAPSNLAGSVSLMGCKPWNAPALGIDVNSSHAGVSASQEFQGQQAVMNGSGNADSYKLLQEAENHRFAE